MKGSPDHDATDAGLVPSSSAALEKLAALQAENRALRSELADRERERTQLHHQQVALRTVIASIPYSVWWKDRNCVYLGCNERFAAVAGLDAPQAMVGLTDYDLPWKKEESDHYREDDYAVMAAAEPKIDIEETLLDANGRETVILTAKVPLRDDDGNVIGTLGTFTDITGRKAMERELGKAKEVAEAANHAKSAFLTTVSHELRTPLALVLGPLDSLRIRSDLPADVLTDIERVYRNAWRLKQQVDDILDFAKTDAGKTVPRIEAIAVDELVASLVEDVRPTATSRGLSLSLEVTENEREPGTGEQIVALLDRRMFEKILLNLVGNALKFTSRGGEIGVTISARRDEIELAVRDSGIGIAEADQALLFQRFQQLDTSSKRRYEGTGLGLAIVKEFAELMGGSVGVESRLGAGARFFVRLPRRSGDQQQMVVASSTGEAERSARARAEVRAQFASTDPVVGTSTPPFGARPCVVLAEDNADLRAYIASLLAHDYDVVACPDGAAALVEIERWRPDVVVSDVMMPTLDGHGLVARMKGDETLKHIPIILLTAQVGRDALVSSLEQGADDFLNKPFSPAELAARIAVAVRLRAAHRALVDRNRELVETRDMLVEAEKLAALGRLLAQLSHEINNPMCVIVGNLPLLEEYLVTLTRALHAHQAIEQGLAPEARAGFARIREELEVEFILADFSVGLQSVGEAAERVRGIQRDLRAFLRGESVEKTAGDLNDAVRVTIDVVKRGISPDLAIRAVYGDLPPIRFNLGQLKQVFLNILKNAADSLGRSGEIEVTTRTEGNTAIVSIADSGPGVPEAIRSKIFEPFFSTKDTAQGSGLGLAVCRQIVADHGGTIRLDELHRPGARFIVALPLSST